MPFLLATANKSGVEMASLEIAAKNVAETPEARFKQKAHDRNTQREKIGTMLEILKGTARKEV